MQTIYEMPEHLVDAVLHFYTLCEEEARIRSQLENDELPLSARCHLERRLRNLTRIHIPRAVGRLQL